MPSHHPSETGVSAVWPRDRGALVDGLAVACAFGQLTGPVTLRVVGDTEAARTTLLSDLARAGVDPGQLPLIRIRAAEQAVGLPVTSLADALARACESARRPNWPLLVDDDRHRAVWAAARVRLAGDCRSTVTVVAETATGMASLSGPRRARVVSGSPQVRGVARRLGIYTVARPLEGRDLPPATALVLDGRRPEDLVLARGFCGGLVIVNGERLTAAALAAFGIAD